MLSRSFNSAPFCFSCIQEVQHGIHQLPLPALPGFGTAEFHGSEASLCTSDQMSPTPVQTQHSKRGKKPLIFGTGISHLVLIDSRAGAQQEQGEGGALELFAHLPKEVTERSTWKRERENNENIPLLPAEFLSAALLSSTPRTAGIFVLPAGLQMGFGVGLGDGCPTTMEVMLQGSAQLLSHSNIYLLINTVSATTAL